ncbi:hypothetical protein [Streptomyces sp. NPDC052015]|uniref:hypothetical protein n=1 Tax=Streptomyces sp. NPDC052015 TaxID=3154755 RepID=UPI0034218A57
MHTKTASKRPGTEATAAIAAGAAQLPAVFLLWWLVGLPSDPYGRDYGGALALLCVFLFAPVYVPLLGLLHALAHTLPGAALADLAFGRLRRPSWARHLLGAVSVGAVWAVVTAVLWDWPFVTTAPVLMALGVLPVLAMAYARRTVPGTWGIWWRAGAASVAFSVLAFSGGALATATGLVRGYEPPELSATRVAGVWRGDDGAELRLLPGGRAELTRMPAEPEPFADADPVVCDGTGTWSLDRADEDGRPDVVVVRLDEGRGTGSGCGNEAAWTIGGTGRAPELFMFVGGPVVGELRILTQAEA